MSCIRRAAEILLAREKKTKHKETAT